MRYCPRPLSVFAASVLFGVVNVGSSAHARSMTLDDIAKIKQAGSATVAPDGHGVAFVERVPRNAFKEDDGVAKTVLKVIRGDGPARLYSDESVAVSSVTWAPSSNAIYYLGRGKDDKQNSLYVVPLDGGTATLVCRLADERNIAQFDLHPDGKRIALLSRPALSSEQKKAKDKGFDAKVYEETVKAQQITIIQPGGNGECEGEALDIDGHISAVGFSPDGNRLMTVVAPTPLVDDSLMQRRMRVLSLEGAELTRIDNLGKLGQWAWSPQGNNIGFIGVSDFNDPGQGRLKVANSANGKFRTLFEGIEGHFQRMVWASDTSLYALFHIGVESELWLVNIDSGERQKVIEQGDGVIHSISGSADGSMLVLTMSTSTHPPELFKWQNGSLVRLTNSNPWLEEIDFARQEPVRYKASDGLDLEGLLVYPTKYRKGRRYPLVVYVHGGPESHRSNGWLNSYSWPIQVMADEGYAAFIPNFRGSTGRGVNFSKLGQQAYATPEFDDIVDGKNHLVERGIVDAERVGITGGSYGGYATAWSATALTEHYAAGVMFVGISNQISKFSGPVPTKLGALIEVTSREVLQIVKSFSTMCLDCETSLLKILKVRFTVT